METNLAKNERSMLRGLGAASAASALSFGLLNLSVAGYPAGILYALSAIITIVAMFQLIADNFRDFGIRTLTYSVMTAAYGFMYYRVGFIPAILRAADKGKKIDAAAFRNMMICAVIAALAAIIVALIIIICGYKSKKYSLYIEKKENAQHKIGIVSIAAALICMVLASMIFG
ncbi:MAG: hypothetical protein ACI4JE_05710 [Ruminococcus sp.]